MHETPDLVRRLFDHVTMTACLTEDRKPSQDFLRAMSVLEDK